MKLRGACFFFRWGIVQSAVMINNTDSLRQITFSLRGRSLGFGRSGPRRLLLGSDAHPLFRRVGATPSSAWPKRLR